MRVASPPAQLIKSFEDILLLTLITASFLAITCGVAGSVILDNRTNDVHIGVTHENMQERAAARTPALSLSRSSCIRCTAALTLTLTLDFTFTLTFTLSLTLSPLSYVRGYTQRLYLRHTRCLTPFPPRARAAQWLIYVGAICMVIAIISYSIKYVRTLSKVRGPASPAQPAC